MSDTTTSIDVPKVPTGGSTAPTAPSPADVAAMLQQMGKATSPASQPAQAPSAPVQGFTPEQLQQLLDENQAAKKAAAEAQRTLAAARAEANAARAQVAAFQRESTIRTVAGDTANAALLLDSASFQTAIENIDATDAAALGAAVKSFVEANPAYATTPQLPGTSGGTPTGGTTSKPSTLEGAVVAALGG